MRQVKFICIQYKPLSHVKASKEWGNKANVRGKSMIL